MTVGNANRSAPSDLTVYSCTFIKSLSVTTSFVLDLLMAATIPSKFALADFCNKINSLSDFLHLNACDFAFNACVGNAPSVTTFNT